MNKQEFLAALDKADAPVGTKTFVVREIDGKAVAAIVGSAKSDDEKKTAQLAVANAIESGNATVAGSERYAAFKPLGVRDVRALEAEGADIFSDKNSFTTMYLLCNRLWVAGDTSLLDDVMAIMSLGGQLLGDLKAYHAKLGNE